MAQRRPFFDYREATDGQWYWVLVGANNEVMCRGEYHRDKHDAKRAAKDSKAAMKRALVD